MYLLPSPRRIRNIRLCTRPLFKRCCTDRLEAFQYLDPKRTGYITDHERFAEVKPGTVDSKPVQVAMELANLKGSKEEADSYDSLYENI